MAAIIQPTSLRRISELSVNGAIHEQIEMTFADPVRLLSLPTIRLTDGWGNSRTPISAAPNNDDPAFQLTVSMRFRRYPSVGNLTIQVPNGEASIEDAFGNTMTPGEYTYPSPVAGVIAIDVTGDNQTDRITCNFAEDVDILGTPQYLLYPPAGGTPVLPTSVAASTASTITLQYPANSAPQGQYIQVPFRDPAIRTLDGSYVAQAIVPINPAPPTPLTPVSIVGDDVLHTITLTFAVDVTLGATPAYTLTPLLGPPNWPMLAAAHPIPPVVVLDIDPLAISVGGTLTIPPIEPAIRGLDGAYVAAGTYPVT